MCATAKGARLNNMVPVPRVPKTNGEIPSFDEAFSDHRRLLDKLVLYGLVELTVNGDDNCQFWALSDQFYRTPEHRRFVRQQVVNQGFGGDADGRREVHGLGGVVDADVRRGEAAACHLPLAPQHTGKQSIRHPEHER
uniref:OTU domain-containing protein n=1 Tax=Aegilops tauschii subsp. strangulata TaxID=200361 RepID=A0A453PS19_AEGTS